MKSCLEKWLAPIHGLGLEEWLAPIHLFTIHPNDGDISRHAELDADLLARVKETFLHVLFLVYEAEHEKTARLSALRSKAKAFKR